MSTDSSYESPSRDFHYVKSPSKDFFELFALPRQFDVDLKSLKSRYRELQFQWHPDRFSAATEAEKIQAVKMSSLLNDAYEILSHEVKRANYLLALEGVDLQKDRAIDSEILMEQIRLRESFEEISLLQGEQQQLHAEQLLVQLRILFTNAAAEFSTASKFFFKQGHLNDRDADLQKLKQLLSKMMFLNKLSSDVELFVETFD